MKISDGSIDQIECIDIDKNIFRITYNDGTEETDIVSFVNENIKREPKSKEDKVVNIMHNIKIDEPKVKLVECINKDKLIFKVHYNNGGKTIKVY